ncbi:DeoR/GlpR family DNA-binding transcription regulator [Anaerococcus nagyae]|uniref:DeoR/GlpR family DNA-binding transcription regulator n=1 Tax=Anaerococcus nagyae TaxID=1755241 RepID=UPI001AE487DF|nr:DeoR/GlpR family DNA-binding transcription regulator [Anaerococcus nagyae]MBP2069166.1 DeoR family lactose phosphotransferase system repressor [Anaerococcus nagyae]
MLKEKRQDLIVEMVNDKDLIEVSDLTTTLEVTEMTIRRDLKELEGKGLLKRVHGGARKIKSISNVEYSNAEKKEKNITQKKYISKQISEILKEDDIVFFGAGTTIEFVPEYIGEKRLKAFTNSLYLFNELLSIDTIDLKLIGGSFRNITGAFVGPMAVENIKNLRFKKAFIGVNGINDNNAFTYNEDEGYLQKLVLDNSIEKYLVADSSKIGVEDFYSFYNIDEVNIITDDKLSKQDLKSLKKYTKVIN